MKPQLKSVIILSCAALILTSCHNKSDIPGFKKTESGLHYKFEKVNKKAQLVQMDDALVCELVMWLNNDTLYNNMGDPQRLMTAGESLFSGAIEEGLLMMHVGDEATFAIEADSLAQYWPMPDSYRPGDGNKMYYHIILHEIVSAENLAQEASNFIADMDKLQADEPTKLEQYITDNNITAAPDEDGLYVIVSKKGNGPKIGVGKVVTFNYTGRLIDGTMFDSNVESDAQEGGIYEANRTYAPARYEVGKDSYVKGLMKAFDGMAQGTVATIIIPSNMGYGSEWRTEKIPPFSTLIFDVEILSVK